MGGTEAHVDFDSPATLRKWPSLNNERLKEGRSAYLVFAGTLDECIREFMAGGCHHRVRGAWLDAGPDRSPCPGARHTHRSPGSAPGVSSDEAVATVQDVLGSIGDTRPSNEHSIGEGSAPPPGRSPAPPQPYPCPAPGRVLPRRRRPRHRSLQVPTERHAFPASLTNRPRVRKDPAPN
jgi:hypothetical protein